MLALAGNKSDKAGDLVVSLEEAHNFAQKHDISIVMEVSAKQNTGITEVFEQISAELIKKHKE
jgi:glycine cleavage system regulatory protein